LAVKSYWLELNRTEGPLAFDDIGLSVFSQNNEDGILLYLFSEVKFKTRKSIEIGCNVENSTIGLPEANTINLIVNFNFHGLIIDMGASNVDALRHFFASCITTRHFHQAADVDNPYSDSGFYSPVLVNAQVSTENINQLAADHGFAGEVDLLSVDVDGNDIKVFEAISAFSPRVVVIEVNNRMPFEERKFAPGSLPLRNLGTIAARQSVGASLAEIIGSSEERGFVFVGMNNNLINAFFIRRDVFEGSGLSQARLEDYLNHPLRPPESLLVAKS
jgi:hypothetical protein